MQDWFDGVNLYFASFESPNGGYSVVVQTSLTILAAFLGAGLTFLFTLKSEQRRHLSRLNSAAHSVIYKLSTAASIQKNLKEQFFGDIPLGVEPGRWWLYVRGSPEIPEEDWSLSASEYEFLASDDNETDLAQKTAGFLSYSKMNLKAWNFYSKERANVQLLLDPHTDEINTEDQSIQRSYDPTAHPGVRRLELETADLCHKVGTNLDSAIADAISIIEILNDELPRLTKNPKFSKRIDASGLNR